MDTKVKEVMGARSEHGSPPRAAAPGPATGPAAAPRRLPYATPQLIDLGELAQAAAFCRGGPHEAGGDCGGGNRAVGTCGGGHGAAISG